MEKKVLVIDDDTQIRDLLYDALTKSGYKVITSGVSSEALPLIQKEKPDLVLLDFKMSGENGLEILKRIRELNLLIKVVILTGLEDKNLEREARLLGASGFLRKSLGVEAILKAVNQILQRETSYQKEKILVVDDDKSICSLIKDFLEKKGFSVETAYTGEEGLEKFRKIRPILILLDIRLPGMDGLLTLKKIREIDQNIGVIMITGLKDEETAQKALELGAYEYIVKPFDLNYLELCVLTRLCIVSALIEK
ncbi:MAG: hypothetical protein DRP69_04245 [Candidatus Duberdicusella sinuisediminis]|nr:MAG: hypothetical protein DRP69_04245 [Candidatus Omnitrophota bacterium]